jgi:H+/Cl- antiporter ClcA
VSASGTGSAELDRSAEARDDRGDDRVGPTPGAPPRAPWIAPIAGRGRGWLERSLARGNSRGLTALALLTGVGAGLGAVAFRYMILGFTYVFTGHRDYSAVGHADNPVVPGLGIWFVVLAPVFGGLVYGPLVARFAPEARGHGVPEVMLAVNRMGGRIRPQVPVVKSLGSAICIGSGGSVGREGPIVQIGSAIGSVTGRLLRVPESQLRLLVACGAAGGISATFNAPIAGVFFALELILRNFQTQSFGLVVLSSVTADAIGRAAFGNHPFLSLPAFDFSSPLELALYAGLGVLAPGVGVAFVRVLYSGEDLADRLWRGPGWLRPAAGGILLGLLLLAVPQMYGVGYPVLQEAVGGHYVILALLGLLAAKVLATSLTMWIGGSGGVFAPSLFMGAMLGCAYGAVVHQGAAAPGRRRWRVRPGRDGSGVRGRGARADHRGDHHLRADRRLPDHPAADVRDRRRDGAFRGDLARHDLHAQAPPPGNRCRPAQTGRADGTNPGRRGDGHAAAARAARSAARRPGQAVRDRTL